MPVKLGAFRWRLAEEDDGTNQLIEMLLREGGEQLELLPVVGRCVLWAQARRHGLPRETTDSARPVSKPGDGTTLCRVPSGDDRHLPAQVQIDAGYVLAKCGRFCPTMMSGRSMSWIILEMKSHNTNAGA